MSTAQLPSSAADRGGAATDRGALGRFARESAADDTKGSGSTHGRILAAAERLFAEKGFSGVSMPMIASASGITAGAIYRHFEGKADLFFEVVRRAVQSAPMPPQGGSEASALPRTIAAYTTSEFERIRKLAVEVHYASANHPKVRRLLRRSLRANIQQIRAGLEAMQQVGDADPSIDSQSLAYAVLVFIMGLMHMETLAPQLVGDVQWNSFVQNRVAAMIGLHAPTARSTCAEDNDGRDSHSIG